MNDDPRFPHLSSGYAAKRATLTAPRSDAAPTPTPTVDHAMLPGRALEEMTVNELRDRASDRGIPYRGKNKAALVEALRE